ncbi:hypothetical protein GCM10027345_07890 [Hymenobacter daeguensis]
MLLGAWLVRDYGISVDESTSRENGMVSLKYVLQRFAPALLEQPGNAKAFEPFKHSLHEYKDRDYGVAFELPVSVAERALGLENPREIYWLRHFCTFLVCWGGVLAVYQLSRRRFADWRWGLFGALLLVLSPRLFAESFYNDKDAVFMALCAIATNTAVRFLQRPTWGRGLVHAFACALAIDVRIMAVLWPLATVAMLVLRSLRGEYQGQRLVAALGLGYLVLMGCFVVAMWPFLWEAPVANFLFAFQNMMHFRWGNVLLFNGNYIDGTAIPWTYAPVWIGITTPLPHLVLLLLGLGAVLWQVGQRRLRLYATEGEWQDLFFVGLGVLPVVAVIALHSVLYDGWRQLYFVYPALVLLAVRGAVLLAGWRPTLASSRRWWPLLYAGVLVVSLATVAVRMGRMHPYQNTYFNALAGKDIAHRYEMDYWGLSQLGGLQWIVAHSDGEARVYIPSGMDWNGICSREMLPDFSQPRIRIVEKLEDADYFMTTYRWHPEDQPYEEVYRIQPDGLRILSVFRLH